MQIISFTVKIIDFFYTMSKMMYHTGIKMTYGYLLKKI